MGRAGAGKGRRALSGHIRSHYLIAAGFAVMIFFGCILSPPSLMDDVDSVQAQIARNMVQSGDWVTARLDGVAYLEKSPLVYWMMAVSYKVFGFHDWAARIPIAASVVLLCWIVCKFGEWAFGATAGMYAGICLATCVGLFLFTRILIPDCILTLAIAVALYSMLRLLEDDRPARWPMLFWASTAIAVLLKGLIGVIFPIGAGVLFLVATRRLTKWKTLKSFRPVPGLLLFLAIAAPWFVVATIRNPPLFDFTTHSESGSYHGFFWFYFINEHVLRFLNRRYPRDYNTVPHLYFWLFHLLWLFPWSVYLPAVFRLDYRSGDRAARVRLLSVCWIGFVLVFFSLSTSQEYYTMPCYPAFALLIGSALASKDRTLGISTRLAAAINMAALIAILAILYMVRHVPTPGDISVALTEHPEAYTLSLGHMEDLTTQAFAYLRLPLVVAGIAFAVGVIGTWRWMEKKTVLLVAVMMALFFHAARLAMVAFDPYLSSRPLAEALLRSPEGTLIVDNPYWEFSSVFFYSNSRGLLLNGRRNNLEYGSYAPGAPNVFLQDSDLAGIWKGQTRCYLLTEKPNLPRIRGLLGVPALHEIKESGGKYLFSNQ